VSLIFNWFDQISVTESSYAVSYESCPGIFDIYTMSIIFVQSECIGQPGKVFAVGYIKGICESSEIPLKLLIKIKHFIIRFCKLII
jgi:hypothetical protein